MASKRKIRVICYTLGAGADWDPDLSALSRQLCEDIAELLALHADFVTIPQLIVVRESIDGPQYALGKQASVLAVFYSLPETRWIVDATKALGGDMAVTGRIHPSEEGYILSFNILDIERSVLLFCGHERCTREELHLALRRLAARILHQLTQRALQEYLPLLGEVMGTDSYHAYANWMNMRELQRRAHREATAVPKERLVEHLCYALKADPNYERARSALAEMMQEQLNTQSYHFILRQLEPLKLKEPDFSSIFVQCFARVGQRDDALSLLDRAIQTWPDLGLFWLMRGALGTDSARVSGDLSQAERLLGAEFARLRRSVDNGLLNVLGR